MDHVTAETLLGAYALDAVDADEAREVEEHLAGCPRCRAELAAHFEVAGALGNFGAEAPDGLWQKIAGEIARDGRPAAATSAPVLLGRVGGRSATKAKVTPASWRAPVLAGIAAVIVALLVVQVARLNNELNGINRTTAASGLAPVVAQVALGAHQTVQLTSATSTAKASVVVAPNGVAYWVSTNLANLPADRSYQLWAVASGRVVSIAVIGADPHGYAQIRLSKNMTRLMVTAEPEGGSTAPTTSPLIQAPLSGLT